jgi:hypothetical protein
MTAKELFRWEFEKEIKELAVSCIGINPNTAKRKASNLIKKYSPIIAYSSANAEYHKKDYWRIKSMFDAIKTGVVNYQSEGNVGTLLIKDIEQVEVRQTDVLLITKSGREIVMGQDFSYLKDIL